MGCEVSHRRKECIMSKYRTAPSVLTVLTLSAFSLPLSAKTHVIYAPQQANQEFTRHVSFADLDLSSDAGAKVLRRRVSHAAQHICRDKYGAGSVIYQMGRCTQVIFEDTKPRLDAVIAQVRAGHAVATSFAIHVKGQES
jgi:UrcA family protein